MSKYTIKKNKKITESKQNIKRLKFVKAQLTISAVIGTVAGAAGAIFSLYVREPFIAVVAVSLTGRLWSWYWSECHSLEKDIEREENFLKIKNYVEEKPQEGPVKLDPVLVFKKEADQYLRRISIFTKVTKNKALGETVSSSLKKINSTLAEVDESEIRTGELSKYCSKYLKNYASLLDSYTKIYKLENVGSEYKETLVELEEAIIQYDAAFDGLYKKAVESDLLAASIDASVNKKLLQASGLLESDFKLLDDGK